MENTAEIIKGLDLKDINEKGAVFDLNFIPSKSNDKDEENEISATLQHYLNVDCVETNEEYDGNEPFSNLSTKMHSLLQNGKIKKRVIREGYGSYPDNNTLVNIHYNAYVQYEAEPFDSTYARKKPFSFKLGENEVIEGLELAVQSMKLNEKSQFLIDPEIAYRSGSVGRIPPDSVVLFEIELCEVQISSTVETSNENHFDVVFPKCMALCVQGKKRVTLKDYDGAIKIYLKAVQQLEDAILKDYEEQLKSEELLVRLYTNLLVCYTNAQIPKRGCVFAQKIYQLARNDTFKVSAKVYFNHAKCQRMLGGYEHAKRRLIQANRLEPNNKEIQEEFEALKQDHDKFLQQQRKFGKALIQS